MSRFVSHNIKNIDLGNDEWIAIKADISYEIFEKLQPDENLEGKKDFKHGKKILFAFITDWNLKDDKGEKVPVTEQSILDLNMETLNLIINEITKIMNNITSISKKKLENS